jgi:polynucleotide 5'-hydroxyl-kinase GRC3/NOL9
MPPSGDWRAALDRIGDAGVAMVIGGIDAGKTTLVAALASELAARGASVGVVDSDVGQSEIGPPTTVGLGRVAGPITRLADATLIAFQFAGVASPARDIRAVVEATRRMVARARAERLDHVLVDTSGLVLGWPGQMLKGRKIEAVDPDVVIVLERGDECAPIVAGLAGRPRPQVVRLPARGRPGSRTPAARRQHREAAFDAYLRDARSVRFARAAVALELPRGREPADAVGALCGLDDADGDTIALGIVEDVTRDAVRACAPLPPDAVVRRVRVGRERRDGTPQAPAPVRSRLTPPGQRAGGVA